MRLEAIKKLVIEIKKQKTERQNLELKSANLGFPGRIYDTLSSFSNQDDGGIIIFGITDKPNFDVVGVYDAEDVQKKITESCNQMEPKIRALITICEIENKTIVVAEIPGVEITRRPAFYKGAGRLKGSYIRVGDADEPMSEYEIYSFEAFKKRIKEDLRPVENANFKLFNQDLVELYLKKVKSERKNLSENVNDDDILELMGITIEKKPTMTGLMVFSRYPQTYFPQLSITAVVVPGTEIGDYEEEGERFIDNKRITGSIPDMLEEAVNFVRKNSRTKTIIDESGLRRDKTEYPMRAVREAIVNALVHRDYSIYSENIPISIEMYRDRMVIKNSGGLYGVTDITKLGSVRIETRNAVLANALEMLKLTENRYSGIPTIFKEFEKAGLPKPEFKIKHGEFIVTFRNNLFNSELISVSSNTNKDILDFCSVPRSRKELVEFTGKSRYYTMSAIVQPLIDSGKLKLMLPEKPKSSKQRYICVK